MRAVAQRVRRARIRVGGAVVGEMGAGLLALVGVGRDDGPESAAELARKLVHLRVFDDADGRRNASLLDAGGTLGVVSQFTLFGDARKGRRPSYADAAPPEQAEPLVERVCDEARALGVAVVTGRFRADMDVELVNAGPVTILIDTARRF
ncbi:MAG: D-tyrosyl-tRNA(Tyr) deacylase [Proteobacteria bacterium]|nr:MAG: D-tyrosyl-tRNA(Tyr) deacylase [Pseudomonadota bacterium]